MVTLKRSETLAPMNYARSSHGCVMFDDGSIKYVVVAGGVDDVGAGTNTVEVQIMPL